MTTAGSASLTMPPTTMPPTFRLYLVRAVVALGWAGLLAVTAGGSLTPEESVPGFAIALLILYPVIDVVASLLDARTQRHRAPTNAVTQLVNAGISTVAAVVIAVSASHGADAILRVFGAWALLTGAIQLALGLIRRRRGTPGQWPMMLSGGISTLAGLGFISSAGKSELSLGNLAGYATLGAIFFLVSAWRQRAAGVPSGAAKGTKAAGASNGSNGSNGSAARIGR